MSDNIFGKMVGVKSGIEYRNTLFRNDQVIPDLIPAVVLCNIQNAPIVAVYFTPDDCVIINLAAFTGQ